MSYMISLILDIHITTYRYVKLDTLELINEFILIESETR